MSWTMIVVVTALAFGLGAVALPLFVFGLRGTWSFAVFIALATFNKMRGRPWDS